MEQRLKLHDRLIRVGPERLAETLLELADGDRALKRRLELLAIENDPEATAGVLTKQIAGLRRRKQFVRYGESFALAGELRKLVEAIRERVLSDLPDRAFRLADAFLRTDAKVFERVDDSSGSVADVYRDACLLWLDAAARSGQGADWVERVRTKAADNDYGVRDPLLPNAARLLSEHELRRLARRYEDEAKRAKPDAATGRPDEAWRHWSDVGQVARALRDPALLERAERTRGRPVDDRLRIKIAEHCVAWNQIDEALARLAKVADRDDYSCNSLLLKCYESKGDTSKQIELLWSLFESVLAHEQYSRLLGLLPERRQGAARKKARALALRHSHATTAVEFLLRAGWEDDAERVATERRDELDDAYYGTLIELTKLAAVALRPRIEIVCYRRLLRSILNEKRSKAYGHAARYFRRLAQLDTQTDGYGRLRNHTAFVEELRAAHGRKYGFWNRVEPPS